MTARLQFEVVAWTAIRSGACLTIDTRQASGASRKFVGVDSINVEAASPNPVLDFGGGNELELVLVGELA